MGSTPWITAAKAEQIAKEIVKEVSPEVHLKTINGESLIGEGNIQIEGGTEVIANPETTGEEDALESIQIGETKYKIEGGSATVDDYIDYDFESENPVQNKVIAKETSALWNENLNSANLRNQFLELEWIDQEDPYWDIVSRNLFDFLEDQYLGDDVNYAEGIGSIAVYKGESSYNSLMMWDVSIDYVDGIINISIYPTPTGILSNTDAVSPFIGIVADFEEDGGSYIINGWEVDMSQFTSTLEFVADENNNLTAIESFGQTYHISGGSGASLEKTLDYIEQTRAEKIFPIENVEIWYTNGGYDTTVSYEEFMADTVGLPYALNLSSLQYHTLIIPNPGRIDGISGIEIKPADEEYEGDYAEISYTVLGGQNDDPFLVTALANNYDFSLDIGPQPINIKITYDNGEPPEVGE